MRHGMLSAVTTLAALALTTGSALADAAADRCGGSKEKAAGKYAKSVLSCEAKAASNDEAVDPECTSRAFSKLALAFSKAEGVGGCATTGDQSTTASTVDASSDNIVAALAPNPTDEARKCAGSKMKAAGKQLASRLQCYSKAAKNSAGPDPECLSTADAKLVTSFGKAEDKGGCTVEGDAPTIDTLVEVGSRDVVALVSPVCGDDVTGPTNQCDGAEDGPCPGLCTPTCTCTIPPDCGDGTATLPEECDDANVMSGDGCSMTCVLENATALCDGVPSTAGTLLNAVLVNATFNSPIYATAPPLDPARLFVVERDGLIRILDLSDNSIVAPAFLDINDLTNVDGERGLLSMAFDPDYDTNRRFYVSYTSNSGDLTLARYETQIGDPNLADESTAQIVLQVEHSAESNHNGGQLQFGPDGYLYWGMGDGGGGGDPFESGQDDAQMLGKMLRLDVDVAGGPPFYVVPPTNPNYVDGTDELELVWAKGLRNPWRFSFDRANGGLIIGDVGQGSVEEINFQSSASTGGENYGWDIFEGTTCHEPDPAPMCPAPAGYTFPIFDYTHAIGCSITGGYVYRGCALPDLEGTYFYSDFCGNFLRTIDINAGVASNPQNRTTDAESEGTNLSQIVSFGEDARGEVYILSGGGPVYRIEPE